MEYKYFAFISYNSHDLAWGKRLQRELEHYRMPSTLCSKHQWKSRTPMQPIFFAPTDIQPGALSEELQERLFASQHLIVICSPYSARSEWVGREIAYFHSLGRPNNIHFFIVDGIPHSGDINTECFNPILKELDFPEFLGVNIHEKIYRWPWMNKERAYVQLITKLLGIEFDTLWKRHRRLLIQQSLTCLIGVTLVIFSIIMAYVISRPVDVHIVLNEVTPTNTELPALKNARVCVHLKNEEKTVEFSTLDESLKITNVPASMIGEKTLVKFFCENYLELDTMIALDRSITLDISRDVNAFGHVIFTLYDKNTIPLVHKTLRVDGIPAETDNQGKVDLVIPIEKQKPVYKITADFPLEQDLIDAKCTNYTAVFAK